MKQTSFFHSKGSLREHGGALSLRRRRSRRPLSCQEPLHLTLRSDLARGSRSLLRHRPFIEAVLRKASRRFGVRIYQRAICGNHLHLLVQGRRRRGLQNFFRVVAGHIAQEILRAVPLRPEEIQRRGGASGNLEALDAVKKEKPPHPKNQRKFWALLLYSRLLTWGREFRIVTRYIQQNTLEALKLIAYKPRSRRDRTRIGTDKARDPTAFKS